MFAAAFNINPLLFFELSSPQLSADEVAAPTAKIAASINPPLSKMWGGDLWRQLMNRARIK